MTASTSTVVAAIEAAAATDPTNWDLRLHLAELLLGAGRPADALAHAGSVLGARPADAAALAVAARAAEGAGDLERAGAYRRLHAAMAPAPAPAPGAAPAT